jgi:hypothetical protein
MAKMNVPVDKVCSDRGELIFGGWTFAAYKLYLAGEEDEARRMLEELHFTTYYKDRRNITTDKIVAEIYKERGAVKPTSHLASDPDIVRDAVRRRVNGYLEQLCKFRDNGYIETDEVRMVRHGGNLYRMTSCGENKVAALAALGHAIIPNVAVS